MSQETREQVIERLTREAGYITRVDGWPGRELTFREMVEKAVTQAYDAGQASVEARSQAAPTQDEMIIFVCEKCRYYFDGYAFNAPRWCPNDSSELIRKEPAASASTPVHPEDEERRWQAWLAAWLAARARK